MFYTAICDVVVCDFVALWQVTSDCVTQCDCVFSYVFSYVSPLDGGMPLEQFTSTKRLLSFLVISSHRTCHFVSSLFPFLLVSGW
mmetsp:Transcript_43708/g.113955  ORF Transcript_43708/g.113955 Transcript_43708/m.113955 type:complete len:85 (-) Transcript_43708:1608-1862(-)